MTATSLQKEIVSALKNNASHDDLAAVVLRYKARGVSQQATYSALECVRMELGCNDDTTNPLCERLEDIMDRVWGFCPQADLIWDSPLSEVQRP